MIVRVEVGAAGKKLVASNDVAAGMVLTHFRGPIVKRTDVRESDRRYALMIAVDGWLVPENESRWINHSCDANAWIEADTWAVVAQRPLRQGDEVTIDYATVSVDEYRQSPDDYTWDPAWSFDCLCGSALCRGRVDGYVLCGTVKEWNLGPSLEVVSYEGQGRGIRALRTFRKGECIERSHVIVIPKEQWPNIEHTVFYDHTFYWGEDEEDAALSLGFGSLFNHSYTPNAVYQRLFTQSEIHFFALRDIVAGEQITVNYNGAPDDGQPLWFSALP